jgi:SAM-dependent methyltransferase
MDFAFMSQALHHADRPDALLAEVARVLKPSGAAIVIGEHPIRPRDRARHFAKVAVGRCLPRSARRRVLGTEEAARRPLRPIGTDLSTPDPVLGDHLYSPAEYESMFSASGFRGIPLRGRGDYQGFVLLR